MTAKGSAAMTKVAFRARGIYNDLKELLVEARGAGLEKCESYRRLLEALNELAATLHSMLCLDERLDPESEEAIKSALGFHEIGGGGQEV